MLVKIWKYVLVTALGLLAFGVLLGGTGLLTGASLERTWADIDLQTRLTALLEFLRRFPLFQLFPN